MKFAKRASIQLTETGRMNDLAQAKRRAGAEVYNFSAGDPACPTHRAIDKGVRKALSRHSVPYPPLAGIPDLRGLVAEWMARKYSARYGPSEVLVTSGGKFALFLLAQALLEEGDEVILPAPYWVSYLPIINLCGAKVRVVRTEERREWKVTPADLALQHSPRSKLLILNNGCNPTGALYTRDEIEQLLEWAREHDLFVISDEVYSEILFDGRSYTSCASFPKFQERVAIVQSCSKNFGMTGWRIGFVLSAPPLMEALIRLQGQTLTGASLVSQWAAVAALENADLVAESVRQEMARRRDLFSSTFYDLFNTQLTKPPSAIYYFIELKKMGLEMENSLYFCEQALESASVAAVPGIAFGQEGYVRFAFSGREEEIVQGLTALHLFCKELKR